MLNRISPVQKNQPEHINQFYYLYYFDYFRYISLVQTIKPILINTLIIIKLTHHNESSSIRSLTA